MVEVRRGSYVESTHAVSVCIATADGSTLHAFGDTDVPYPVCSLANPFVAVEFVRSGAAETCGAGEIEIALAAGSHDGEERHAAAIRAFLARIGITEDYLLCGPDFQGRISVGPPVAHTCSGKHAAILALCRHLSFSIEDYTDLDHPAQRLLSSKLLEVFGRNGDNTPPAIDGCGMPVFGASLRQIATAYARFGIHDDPPTMTVRAAMTAEPGYVGGWFGNLDTRVITWSRGAIIGKSSQEGLHADALVGQGVGIAVKVQDGARRALPPVLAQLLTDFMDEVPITQEHLMDLATPPVLNASGHKVGEVRANGLPSFRSGVHVTL